jgi:hypothetical protein
MDTKEILMLIEKISPHSRDYVNKAFENNQVDILYSISTEENKGVFIVADNEECCIFYVE